MIELVENPDVLRPFAASFPGKRTLLVGSGCNSLARYLDECGASVEHSGDLTTPAPGQRFDLVLLVDQPPDLLPQIPPLLHEAGILIIVGGSHPGQRELTALLHDAGFDAPVFYYPFPDYLHPSVLLCQEAFLTPGFNTGNLIRPAIDKIVTHLIPTLLADGRMSRFANAVLIVAARNGTTVLPPEQLAFSFSANRTAAFNKMNVFYKNAEGRIMVRHIPYDPAPTTGDDDGASPILAAEQLLTEEAYLPGRLYSLELQELFLTPEWSVQTLRDWARPYLDLLRQQAQTDDGGGWLDGRYLDLTPFNLIRYQGRLAMIDLEWKARAPLPLPYVFFRGLYHTFARIPYVLTPAPGTPLNILGLVIAVARALGFDTTGMLENFLELEAHYFGAVFRGNGLPDDADLHIPATVATPPAAAATPTAATAAARLRLYPLLNLHLQVFVESGTRGFCEETSTWRSIGLTPEPKFYSIPLPHFTADTVRLRIDPSDHNGLIRLHAVDLRTTDGVELFHWTPFSRSDAALSGMMILNAGPHLPEPVTILLNADPMLVLPLPGDIGGRLTAEDAGKTTGPVMLELELSSLPPELFDAVAATLCDLAQLVSP